MFDKLCVWLEVFEGVEKACFSRHRFETYWQENSNRVKHYELIDALLDCTSGCQEFSFNSPRHHLDEGQEWNSLKF
jgi:hypothetical protein